MAAFGEVGEQQRSSGEQRRSSGEKRDILRRCMVFLEWAGDATGTLAFLWATVVVLGGFSILLKPGDFWCAATIILIEAFRMFTKGNTLSKSFFETMWAINSVPVPIRRWLLQDRTVFYTTLVLTCLSERIITYCPFTLRGLLRIALAVILIFLRFIPFRVPRQLRHNQGPVLSFLLIVLFILTGRAMHKLAERLLQSTYACGVQCPPKEQANMPSKEQANSMEKHDLLGLAVPQQGTLGWVAASCGFAVCRGRFLQ
ncbi:uncharacterized protein LOC125532982 [Triticum urartu]|uniref:uncharacterized protein LOC125532982 n=1 Tax=Triticum urartu TaxID=4572 RepID=UPI0020433DC1|nr:uncharacterized protein LOC125532982 [Triticum urartu]